MPPKDRKAERQIKFHCWCMLTVKGLMLEKALPPGEERHIHETMRLYNTTLFKNAEAGKSSKNATDDDDDDDDGDDIEDDFKKWLEECLKCLMLTEQESVSDCFCLAVEC